MTFRSLSPATYRHALAVLATAVLLAAALLAPRPALATSAQEIVDRAQTTVQSLHTDEDFVSMRPLLDRARAVIIVPELVKAGFIVGGEGGEAVMLVRQDGGWSLPAFYLIASGSIGLQAGVQSAEVILLVMSEEALAALRRNEVKLGGEVSVAVGPIGIGLEAATTANLDKDVYAFTRARGLFGGGALEGSLIRPRPSRNDEFYGQPTSVADIFAGRGAFNAGADALREALRLFP
ncbi:MAG: lipid-binding SYLF domain-containing protein [Alphaproteobacteria bacterium]